ncbi:hypothetical protein FF1_010674 [Malus domestica]
MGVVGYLRERGRDRGRGSGFVPLAKGACSVFKSYIHHRKGPARFPNFSQNVYGCEPKTPPFLTDPKISPFPTPKTTDYLWVVADFAAHSSFTVIALNPENEPRASREVEKPSIEPILPPMVEKMRG